MSKPRRFRAFKQELSSLAGYHTGEALVLDEEYMDEAAILLHEQAHDHIFSDTVDGRFHKAVMTCLSERIYPKHTDLLRSINDFLFEDTRLPHERAATFLGVIGLSNRTAMLDAQAMLNQEYSDYFTYFSDFLPWRDSSFVSYIIANAMTRFAFTSGRTSKISDLSTLTIDNLQSVEGPEQRMDAVKRGFIEGDYNSPNFIRVIFEAVIRSHSIEPYDIFDDSAWEARINSGVTDTSIIERFGCFAFESMFSRISGIEAHIRATLPECFKSVDNLIPKREFDVEFPIIDGVESMPEDAALFYAREADKNAIRRRKFIEIPEHPLDTSLELLARCITKDLCVIFMQLKGQPRYFKMFSSITYNEELSFLPGSGLVVDLDTVIALANQLGYLTIEHNLLSPLFYIIYTPGAPDEEDVILLPQFENIKLFTNHLSVDRVPSAGQGLLIRPIVYGRPFWAYALENATGEFRDYSAMMIDRDAPNDTVDCWVQIIIPEHNQGLPAIAILDRRACLAYKKYVQFRIDRNDLTYVPQFSIDRGISESLQAVWQTLTLV